MPTYDGGVSNPGYNVSYTFRLNTSENIDAASNISTINWEIILIRNNFAVWNLNSGQTSWGANIGGYTYGGTFAYDFRNYSSLRIYGTTTGAIGHDINGAGSINVSASFSGPGPLTGGSAGGPMGLTDFNRSALQASPPSVSRSSNGQTLFYSAIDPGALNNGPQRDFAWQYRTESGSFVDLPATAEASGSSVNVGSAGQHTTYRVRVLAYNSDNPGNSGWSGESVASHGIPNTPSNPSATRSTSVGGRVDLSWGSPSYVGGGVTKYQVYRNGTLVRDSGTGTTFADTGLVKGTTYNYTINAVNSTGAGTSTTTVSAMAPGVPSPPGIPTVTNKVGRNLTINSARTSLNYGNNITEYRIQLSTDDGATWKGWDNSTKTFTANGTHNTLDSSGNITYELLAPALTYKWRTYAVNSIGDGELATTPTGVFVSSGGKRWTGTEWSPTEVAKRWDGTQWLDLTIAKRWDGSSWVDLT